MDIKAGIRVWIWSSVRWRWRRWEMKRWVGAWTPAEDEERSFELEKLSRWPSGLRTVWLLLWLLSWFSLAAFRLSWSQFHDSMIVASGLDAGGFTRRLPTKSSAVSISSISWGYRTVRVLPSRNFTTTSRGCLTFYNAKSIKGLCN